MEKNVRNEIERKLEKQGISIDYLSDKEIDEIKRAEMAICQIYGSYIDYLAAIKKLKININTISSMMHQSRTTTYENAILVEYIRISQDEFEKLKRKNSGKESEDAIRYLQERVQKLESDIVENAILIHEIERLQEENQKVKQDRLKLKQKLSALEKDYNKSCKISNMTKLGK